MSDKFNKELNPFDIIELDISQYKINDYVPLDKTVYYQLKRDEILYELQQMEEVVVIEDNIESIELEFSR